jgi:acetate kinase
MNILTFNCGSSSLSYKIFQIDSHDEIEIAVSGKAHRVGVTGSEPSFIEHNYNGQYVKNTLPIASHREAAALVFQYVKENSIPIDLIGHRFVHGATYFPRTAIITEKALEMLEICLPFAPLHNPISLSVIKESLERYPSITEYLTFDGAFHSTIPDYAYTYALPSEIIEQYGYRKYGFHGLSFQYVSGESARFLNIPLEKLKLVMCHLGTGGSSVCAVKDGYSIDNSLGYTPLPGLIMSTRSGDIDPMAVIFLMNNYGYTPDSLEALLNKKSGILGISGFSSDPRDIIEAIKTDETKKEIAQLALDMYVQRLKKYIGAYIAVMGGIDALVFTDDVGVLSAVIREKVCESMGWCGVELDYARNRTIDPKQDSMVNSERSKVYVMTVPTAEELVICREGLKLHTEGEMA